MKTLKKFDKFKLNENTENEKPQDESEKIEQSQVTEDDDRIDNEMKEACEEIHQNVKNYLSENNLVAETELIVEGPELRIFLEKTNECFSSKYLDIHYSSHVWREQDAGQNAGGFMGDWTLIEEAYDQLGIINAIAEALTDFNLSVQRTYLHGKFIVFDTFIDL
jgi:hypothetical protein